MVDALVTIIIPVRNARKTLMRTLCSLKDACADVPVRLMICDNASDDAWTNAFVHSSAMRAIMRELGVDDVQVLEDVPCKVNEDNAVLRHKNLEHMMAKFAYEQRKTSTEFVMRVDADLVLPKGAVGGMIDALRCDKSLGVVALWYPPESRHIKFGCTMYREEAFQDIARIGFGTATCDCTFIAGNLVKMGWNIKLLSGVKAEHLKGQDDGQQDV